MESTFNELSNLEFIRRYRHNPDFNYNESSNRKFYYDKFLRISEVLIKVILLSERKILSQPFAGSTFYGEKEYSILKTESTYIKLFTGEGTSCINIGTNGNSEYFNPLVRIGLITPEFKERVEGFKEHFEVLKSFTSTDKDTICFSNTIVLMDQYKDKNTDSTDKYLLNGKYSDFIIYGYGEMTNDFLEEYYIVTHNLVQALSSKGYI